MSTVQYAVRVTTDELLYDETFGMTETGVFCWITGNPGFTGLAANGATGEAGLTGVNLRWNEGWITDEGMGNPSRSIDITTAGNYGTMSGFQFAVADNKSETGTSFRAWAEANDIKFTGRKVEAFTVLNKVFYRIWTGKIANNPLNETQVFFTCDDTYKQIHKPLPPTAISDSNYPNAKTDLKVLPTALGDIPYSEIVQIEGDGQRVSLATSLSETGSFESVPLYAAQAMYYGSNPPPSYGPWTGNYFTYDLYTYGKSFDTGAFSDGTYYLNVVSGGPDPVSSILSSDTWIGDFPDKTQLIPIFDNNATTPGSNLPTTRQSYMTKVLTSIPLFGHNACGQAGGQGQDWEWKIRIADQVLSNPEMYVVDDVRYYLSIVRLPTEYVISEEEISEFVAGQSSHIQLFIYNADSGLWEDVSKNVLDFGSVDAEGHQIIRAPHGLAGEELIPSGIDNYSALITMRIPKIDLVYNSYGQGASTGRFLNDGRRNSSVSSQFITGTGNYISSIAPYRLVGTAVNCLTFDIYITDELRAQIEEAGVSRLFLVPDLTYWTGDAATKGNPNFIFTIDAQPYTVQGHRIDVDTSQYQSKVIFPTNQPLATYSGHLVEGDNWIYNLGVIPTKYWRQVGWDFDNDLETGGGVKFFSPDYTSWDLHINKTHYIDTYGDFSFLFRDAWELKCLSDLLDDKRIQKLRITIKASRQGNAVPSQTWNTNWYQFALVGLKTISLDAAGIFTRIKGEQFQGHDTNSVFYTFRKILEDYDSIPLADIDYNNLSWTRQNWHVGRQLTEQRSSFDYLQELARQSFVGIAPKRDGRRLLSAWREDTDSPVQHNSDSIVRDKISSWQQTPLNQVFNEFQLRYNWDPGLGDYTRSLFVGKVDQDAFPGLTGQWGEYVGSNVTSKDETSITGELSGQEAYPDCKSIWDICHESYTRSLTLNKEIGSEFSDLPWYIDYSDFDYQDLLSYQGVDSSAWLYLRNLCQWATRQKSVVVYSVPLTADNLQQCELLAPVDFSDPIWTSNNSRSGWIVGVEIDIGNDQIIVTSMLEPDSISVDSDEYMQEVGSVVGGHLGDPTITESGSADTITETGVS